MKGLVFLLLSFLCFAGDEPRQGLTAAGYGPPPGARVMYFPKEQSIGRLWIDPWDYGPVELQRRREEPKELGTAQGDVAVPAGMQVMLLFFRPEYKGKQVDLATLDELAPTDLQGLTLPFTHITAKETDRLKRHTSLRSLSYGPLSKADDECLKAVSEMKSLESFSVTETEITDNGMKHLRGLTNLRVLVLYGNKLTGAGTVHLSSLTQLQHLELGHTKVDDEGLKHLANLKHLEYLSLDGAPVTDRGLEYLENLTELRTLHLGYGPRITDAGLDRLMKLKKLEWLELAETDVTEKGRERLKQFLPLLRYVGPERI